MSRILVTGGNGFVAAQIIIAALSRDYHVVATVRSEEKAEQTRTAMEKNVGSKVSNLSFVVVPVVETEGAFDEVLKSNQFKAVIHTATPYHFQAKNPNEMTAPAVNGTKSILKSIQSLAPTVKRVIITSSFASIIDSTKGFRPNYVYSENDWNPITWEETHNGNPLNAYYGAKTWAEKAAWDFIKEEKPDFEVVTICPPRIFGEVAQYVKSIDQLNTSSASLYNMLTGRQKEITAPGLTIFCNVSDVGLAHILAIDARNAGNKRFLICADEPYNDKIISDALIKYYPELAPNVPTTLAGNVTAEGWPTGGYYTGNNSLSKEVLGMRYQNLDDTIAQYVHSIKTLPKSQ
ncbi:NAD(P)-binding protein [Serendipita vermifera]|nr:NAD(P)-binding protein [Serendipita vermifera]